MITTPPLSGEPQAGQTTTGKVARAAQDDAGGVLQRPLGGVFATTAAMQSRWTAGWRSTTPSARTVVQ
jgi:hypothetical protein